ncbi:MAG: isoleucine--tRNA ligase [Alphaproteobacteria bacterium]|nr:isoleucine--tRNA ligase [Alphaproteobacteria bacterium]
MSKDYKQTVFLPATSFAMKAGLPQLEPRLLERWRKLDLYRRLRELSAGRPRFVLHDGPPYANGNIHIGTALNKILKDVVNRAQQMLGKDANYVPGWDCHGLPIEWQIEERYRAAGKNKDDVPIGEFRRECRAFAQHWIGVQAEEFKRLGVLGDWANPYTTMSYAAEAQIVAECLKFLMNGGLYRGARPVMWSVVEKTALAEAEIEYHDRTSTTVHARFPVVRPGLPELAGAAIPIWTTTAWTLPGNRAICFGPKFAYRLIEVEAVAEGSAARVGERLAVVEDLRAAMCHEAGIARHRVLADLPAAALAATVCAHPWRGRGYDFDVPLFGEEHVTNDQGTGFVHTAPGHGAEDFEVGRKHGLETPRTVEDDGTFHPSVPLLAGVHVFKADRPVIDALRAAGALLAQGKLQHSYPHSWRSKAPLIFRNTPQWFISMTANGLRETALAAIDRVRWVPATGRNRIRAMIAERPDWVVSRQRAWGVPIALFVDRRSGEPLRKEAVNQRILAAVREEGAEAWFDSPPERFLGPGHAAQDYEKVDDILDVWFDSGSTHSYVLEQRPDLQWPASLYLEGSDQHRGWFHSSLLESCGTRGRAPYDAVLTHGFVQDQQGRKMSKSLGNVTAPQEVMDKFGADVLRQWVVSADYSEDLRIGPEILSAQVEAYRRLRNTLRFLLGNLAGFSPAERLALQELPALERWVLHRLWQLDKQVRRAAEDYEFHRLFVELYTFCTVDLSALYFDIRKDALYCDAATQARRRATRAVLDEVFNCLTAWLAPIHCFTAEEAWLARFPSETDSVHFRTYPPVPDTWRDEALAARFERVRDIRRTITGALEIWRKERRIGASLQAWPRVHLRAADEAALAGFDLAELAIVSGVAIALGPAPAEAFRLEGVDDVAVVVELAPGTKCERCWQVLPEVGRHREHPGLCRRCLTVVDAQAA